jgi:MoaA/NifB/PqqE/SkfB family radical SAM enzyme
MRENIALESGSQSLNEFLSRTGNLLMHLLNRCNLQCRHCYLEASPMGRHMLPSGLVLRTLDEADDLGIKSVQLSGGEPLLHPHIVEILNAAKGRRFAVSLSTNGTLIDDPMADLLAEINAYIVASIDGPPDYHDSFRGKPGCFNQAEAGISRLIERGLKVRIVTTLCEDNYKHIDWCAAWAQQMKAAVLQFQPLEQVGRGRIIYGKALPEERIHDLFIHLNDLSVAYASQGLQIKMTYQSRAFMIEHPCSAFVCNGKNCHRGVEKELKKIVVREDGSILPELVDIDRRFAIGNLHETSLRDSIIRFLDNGYASFDRLCRQVFREAVVNGFSPLIAWNEILSERSRTFGVADSNRIRIDEPASQSIG